MAKLFCKKFDYPNEYNQSIGYYNNLLSVVTNLGFDSHIVKYPTIHKYYGPDCYPEYILVYIDTNNEIEISVLTIAM